MTRDQWLEQCAERLREVGLITPREAHAVAEQLFELQKSSNGRDPRDWQDPVAAAEEEIQIMGGE